MPDTDDWDDEQDRVVGRRFDEALQAGLTPEEARAFAESGVDVGQLRKLVAAGCPARTMSDILL